MIEILKNQPAFLKHCRDIHCGDCGIYYYCRQEFGDFLNEEYGSPKPQDVYDQLVKRFRKEKLRKLLS